MVSHTVYSAGFCSTHLSTRLAFDGVLIWPSRRQVAVLRMELERESQVSKNFKALQAGLGWVPVLPIFSLANRFENNKTSIFKDIQTKTCTVHTTRALAQAQEMEDARSKSLSLLRDREKWSRISAAHLQSIQDLQRRIAGFESVTLQEMAGGFSNVQICGMR